LLQRPGGNLAQSGACRHCNAILVTPSTRSHRPAPAGDKPALPAPWTAQFGLRMKRYFLLKLVGISLFMWVFFIGYFHVLRHPAVPVTEMPLTALDHLIPFHPAAIGPYLSLWLYVGIAPGLLLRFWPLVVYGAWSAALCLTGLAVFFLAPTAVPKQAIAVNVAEHPAFALLQGIDAAGNACPSLHVATATFAVIWIQRLLRDMGAPAALRAINLGWFLLIVHSTLAIKQHVVLDVVAGALLGAVFAAASLRWRPSDA
jgi:PAP2 superfamily